MTKIMRYDPFRTMRRSFLSDFPMNGWLDDFNDDDILKIDVYVEGDTVVVQADMPGVDPDNVDVQVTSENVTIKATKEEETEEKNREYTRRERRFGSYARTVNFPVQVVPDKAEAEFTDGTLKLVVPKETVTSPSTVQVDVKKK